MLVRVSFLAAAAALLSACPQPPINGAPDGGTGIHLSDAGPIVAPSDAGFDDAGAPAVDAGVNDAVQIESVTPPSGPMSGLDAAGHPLRVRLDGVGFTGDDADGNSTNHVFVDDVEATGVIGLTLPTSLSFFAPACNSPGPKTVRVENPLGVAVLDGGYTCFSPVTVESIDPDTGSTDGGDLVTLHGVAFSDAMTVSVGGRTVIGLTVDPDGTSATFLTPPGNPGRVDVVATDAFGRSDFQLGFTYEAGLRLESVTPNVVDDTGAVVELDGAGFIDDVAATIGGAAATRDNLISQARLRVVVPTGLSGAQDIVVDHGAQSATLAGALVVRPPVTGTLTVTAAVPARADVAGGTELTLVGEQFTGATDVSVGGAAGTFTVVDDRTITLTVPAGAAGPADVVVTTGAGSATLTGGVTYFAPVVIDAVAPAFGPSDGGTAVTLSGRGFVDPAVVTFGGIPATDVVVAADGLSVTATTPAGAAGAVDVVVTANGERGVKAGGFRYEAPLSVLGVLPSRGGLGGDTFVTVTGSGFSKSAVSVFFGDTQALPLDVHVINDSTLTCRTPPAPGFAAGVVDVRVRQGSDLAPDDAVAAGAFTYFQTGTNVLGGVRGGPIDGAVYVTAFDAIAGQPIPGLTAWVGTDGHPVAAGITSIIGTATLSGPQVVGPQTVTIAGDCFSSATFVDVNATELTAYLFPLCPSPPSSGQPPPPVEPATIQGRVFGFAKAFFDPAALDQSGCTTGAPAKCEIAFAQVETTAGDEFSTTPGAGGRNVVFDEGGEYHIDNSRVGRLTLVALAGIFDLNNGTFRLRQLGVRNAVFPQHGVDLVDQDITLTIDLDANIDLSLPDAPLRAVDDNRDIGFLPDITRVIPFLEFGGEGSFAYTQAVEGKRNHALDTMPDVPGEFLKFVSGAYTTDGRNLTANTGTVDLAAGDDIVLGNGTFDWGAQDLQGNFIIVGQVFVTERPDTGTRFASVITNTDGVSTLTLQKAPDFDLTGATYHIGNPGAPSSEVIEPGVGDLSRGGITIQPVLGLPRVLSPVENGVLENRTLRWKAALGQQPTIHDMFLFDPFSSFFGGSDSCQSGCIQEVVADGSRTKVVVPRPPELADLLAVLPSAEAACITDPTVNAACAFFGQDPSGETPYAPPSDLPNGGLAWQHEAIFIPGLPYDTWSLSDLATSNRRAWTTDVHVFVKGAE